MNTLRSPTGGQPAALILAAGYSSRMGGRPKGLVFLGGRTLLERMVAAFRRAGIDRPTVVVGHGREALERACARLKVETVHNREFARGMFSSVQAGLRCLDGRGYGAVLITPVDAALVLPRTIRALAERWDEECFRPDEARRIIIPEFLGKGGHPLLLPARHCAKVLSHQDDDGGLRGYLARLAPDSSIRLPLPDAGILCDLDSPEDCGKAEAFLAATRDRADPSPAEAWQVLLLSGLAEKTVRHSLLVALGAHRLWRRARAKAFSEKTGEASFPALCAGLLHDLARAEPNHARRGAERLRDSGWTDAAFAVEKHMDFPAALLNILESGPIPDEGAFSLALGSACVYLADKWAGNDEILPPAERFAEKRRQWSHDAAALAAIDARDAVTRRLEALLAAAMGAGIAEVVRAPSGDAVEQELKTLAAFLYADQPLF